MASRKWQQLGGALIAAVAAAGTAWNWYIAFAKGYFYGKSSIFMPACFVVGVGMILFPGYREERMLRGEDITKLQGWRLITPRWWAVVAVALIIGLANALLLTLSVS